MASSPVNPKFDQTILPLSLRELTFEAGGRTLIDNITQTLNAGGPTAIMGPNGAGKSLLMRLCHGLLRPSRGEVQWHHEQRHTHAMVFQQPVMLRRSVLQNMEFPLRVAGVAAAPRRERATAALAQAGLTHLASSPARVLSGGEQQRLALSRACVLNPQVIFLDEPTSHLDPAATHAVEAMIRSIHEQGTKIVMATHDLGQARRLASDVWFMTQGRIVEQAPAAEFFDCPGTPAAQAFLKGELYWES